MNITPYAMGTAMMRQYRDLHVTRPGGSLVVSELRDNWSQTGLRQRDFDTALKHLTEEGSIRLEDDQYVGETIAVLTEQGADRISKVPVNPAEVIEESRSAAVLRNVSKRRTNTGGGWMSVLLGKPRQEPREGNAERRVA